MFLSFGSFEILEGVILKFLDGGGVGIIVSNFFFGCFNWMDIDVLEQKLLFEIFFDFFKLVIIKGNLKMWGFNFNGIKLLVLLLDLIGSGGGSKMKVNNIKVLMRFMI